MAGNMLTTLPTLAELEQYNVNRPGDLEGVKASLYDFQAYPAIGATQLTFFQVPIGQSGKTKFDTNMEIAGSLPAPKRFLIQSIEIYYYPGSTVDTFAAAAAALPSQADDVYSFIQHGWIDVFIGSKSYLTESPLGRLPPSTGMKLHSAVASNSATVGEVKSEYAVAGGAQYLMQPPILLVPTQNFNVTLNWPALVPTPSTIAARVGVVMKGILYRNSQ